MFHFKISYSKKGNHQFSIFKVLINFHFRIEKKERSSKKERATHVILIVCMLTVSKSSPKKEIITFTTY